MKYILVVCSLVCAQLAVAGSIKWQSQEVNSAYKTIKLITLQLDEKLYAIPKGSRFELIEISNLNMIKVHLHKYKISNCPANNIETDLQLILVKQPRGSTSVGVNLTRGCVVEVFIDMKEYNTNSFLE